MLVLLDDDAVTTNQIDDTSKSRLSHSQHFTDLSYGVSSAKRVMLSPASVCLSVCVFVNRITHKLKSL